MGPAGNTIPTRPTPPPTNISIPTRKWNAGNVLRNVAVLTQETLAWGTCGYALVQGIYIAAYSSEAICPVVDASVAFRMPGLYLGAFVIASSAKALQYYQTGEVKFTFPQLL